MEKCTSCLQNRSNLKSEEEEALSCYLKAQSSIHVHTLTHRYMQGIALKHLALISCVIKFTIQTYMYFEEKIAHNIPNR